jgi:GNAT superfamily N-acetyltransferase
MTNAWEPNHQYARNVTDILDRAIATLNGYFELGNDVTVAARARLVCNIECADVYDANHAGTIRAASAAEIDELICAVDELFSEHTHRSFKVDARTPSPFEARLLHDGYDVTPELQLILEGPLATTPPRVDIRPVASDHDWQAVLRLTRLDHEEEARKANQEPHTTAFTRRMVRSKQAKAPDLQFFLAQIDGEDCGFFSSWPGADGVGKVEDLFTHPAFRRRGVATALIAHAVADARDRGAGPVLIGADPHDTPKHIYAAMGFRPLCTFRSYTLELRDEPIDAPSP